MRCTGRSHCLQMNSGRISSWFARWRAQRKEMRCLNDDAYLSGIRYYGAFDADKLVGGRPNGVAGASTPQRHLPNFSNQRRNMTCVLTAAKQALKPLRKRSSGPSREIKQTPITRTTNSGLSGIFVRMVCHLLVRMRI